MSAYRVVVVLAATLISACVVSPGSAMAATDGGRFSVLVLGDSYSAGNGARSYIPGSSGGCYRSSENYASVFAREVHRRLHQATSVTNAACGGAVTSDFFVPDDKGRPRQLDAVDKSYDVVFLTIGGNDLNFAAIVKQCLVEATNNGEKCDKLLDQAEKRMKNGGLEQDITRVLMGIRKRVDPRATVVLLGYPYLERDRSYRVPIRRSGRFVEVGKRLRALSNAGNRTQNRIVAKLNRDRGARVTFVSTKRLFTGPPDHTLSSARTNPNRWFMQPRVDTLNVPEMYHPNKKGWAEEGKYLLRVSGVPKVDNNSDVTVTPVRPLPGSPAPSTGPGAPATSPPGAGALPAPYDRVMPVSPTSGPVGYAPGVRGPACTPTSGESAAIRLSVDGAPYATYTDTHFEQSQWGASFVLYGYRAGSHRLSFECLGVGSGGERVVWRDAGFDLTLSGTARATQVQGHSVSAGDDVNIVSGASLGGDPCPALAGGSPTTLFLSLSGGLSSDSDQLPLPTSTAFEPMDIAPDETSPSVYVQSSCSYDYPSGFASFTFDPTTITVSHAMRSDGPSARPTASAGSR